MNTITVPAGQDKVIRLGDGDTLENTLIDQTANGASARVVVVTGNASTTTIKNVGFKGKPASHFGHFQITAQAHDTNGKIVIENVYLADPPRNPSNYDTGGMYVHNRHKGDILIKNCNIQNWGNNAIYAADPGMQGGSSAYGRGTVRVENVFSKSNNISNCRLGSAGSYVKDSVLWADGNAPHAGSAYNERGFWGEFMTTKVLNCDIQATKGSAAIVAIAPHGYQYGEPSVEVDNSRVAGNYVGKHIKEHNVTKNPDTSMPSGVPTSASHAASGQTGPSGLQPGDDLGKWIKNNVNDGGTYKVPSGTYDFTTAVVKKSNFTLTAPEGATLNASGVEVLEILGDGWTLEGFEFKSEKHNHIELAVKGKNWTVKNCAWGGHRADNKGYLFSPVSTGGTCKVERVFMDVGKDSNRDVWVGYGNTGDLWFDRCYFASGGVYGTHSVVSEAKKSTGTVNFYKSYFYSNNIYDIRTGSVGGVCKVHKCVVVDDINHVPLKSASVKHPRAIWAWYNKVEVRDTDVWSNAPEYTVDAFDGGTHGPVAAGSIEMIGGNVKAPKKFLGNVTTKNVGSNPSTDPPSGVPTSVNSAIKSYRPEPHINYTADGLTVHFDGSDTTSPGGRITEYDWDIGGSVATGVKTTYTFQKAGTYTVKLTATDLNGDSGTTTTQVEVKKPKPKPGNPVADFTVKTDGLVAHLNGSKSHEPNGSVQKYKWTISGNNYHGKTLTHKFKAPGTYQVALEVTDPRGVTDTTVKKVTVKRKPQCNCSLPRWLCKWLGLC